MTEGTPILKVSAIKDGTVLDHIPSQNIFRVLDLLDLQNSENPVTIGINLESKTLRHKGIIKIADRYFTDEEVNKLSVIVPNIVLTTIHDYDVTEKRHITMPDEIHNIVRCPNPKCITNHEPMHTTFDVIDKDNGTLRCRYCNKEIRKEDIRLL